MPFALVLIWLKIKLNLFCDFSNSDFTASLEIELHFHASLEIELHFHASLENLLDFNNFKLTTDSS